MSTSSSVADQKNLTPKRLLLHHLPYGVLYVVALGLVAMTSRDAAGTSLYWQMFIGLVALVSIIGGWRFAGTSNDPRWVYLSKQVLHWGALVLVIRLLYTHNLQDFLNDEQDGFVTIYVLGLTAILSGIYLDWRMALFGLFLLLSGVGMAWIDNNAVLISLIAAAAAVGFGVTLLFRLRGKSELSSD
ncbi:MAG: hypothetical protein WAT23_00740 [Chromatiaceae bacterium]